MSLWRTVIVGCCLLFCTKAAGGQQSGVLIGFLTEKPQTEEAQSEGLTVSEVLGAEARTAYLKALPKEGQGEDGGNCGEPTDQDSGWRIDRHTGHWAVFAHQDLGYFGCNVDAFVPFRLQSNVTGDNSPAPDWKRLQGNVKDFRDVYVSPAKDLLIVMTGTQLRFHEYAEGGMPGKLLLTLPVHPIVMLQWLTGKHMQDWTQQLTGIAAHPLPEAQVRAVPAGTARY